MKMLAVMIPLMLSTIILFDGCAKPCFNAPIPQRCVIPYTELPIIDNTPCGVGEYKCIYYKTLKNYEAQKEYGERLKSNSEVCK